MTQENTQNQRQKINLYLVEPTDKLSYQFASLRNKLDENNIPYQLLIGYDEVKQLMNDKINNNVIIINNSAVEQLNIPKQIFEVHQIKIYLFKKKMNGYQCLTTSNEVIDLYRKQMGGERANKKILLRSIKKDLEKSRDSRKEEEGMYDIIMIMYPKRYNQDYVQLFDVLRQYKSNVMPISRENEAQQHRQSKSLLIIEKEAFDSVSQFLISNRLHMDLAVLGFVKGFHLRKNYAIMTEYPLQILDYLSEAGIHLPGAKQKLKANVTAVNQSNMNKQPTAQFPPLSSVKQQSFSPHATSQNFKKEMGNGFFSDSDGIKQQKNSHERGSNGQGMPITSRMSDSSKGRERRSVKKVKKLGTSSDAGSTIKQNNQEIPIINIKLKESEDEIAKANEQYEIHFQANSNHDSQKQKNSIHDHQNEVIQIPQNEINGKKNIMNWFVFPDKNKKSLYRDGPLFIINSPQDKKSGEGNREEKLRQSQKSWRSSGREKEKQFGDDKPVEFVISSPSDNMPITNNNNNINASKLPPRPPLPQTIPSIESVPLQQSRDSMSTPQNIMPPFNGSSNQQNNKQRLQQKYHQSNQIRQVSDEYRGSNLSYPIDENTQRLMGITPINALKNDGKFSRSQPISSTNNPSNKSLEPFYSQVKKQYTIVNGNTIPQVEEVKQTSIYQQNGENNTNNKKQDRKIITNQQQLKKQFQRAQYENKHASTTPIPVVKMNEFEPEIKQVNNEQSAPRIVRNEIRTPEIFYQEESKRISDSNQPIIIEDNAGKQIYEHSPPPNNIDTNTQIPISVNQNNTADNPPKQIILLSANQQVAVGNNSMTANSQSNGGFLTRTIGTELKQTFRSNASEDNANNVINRNQPYRKISTFPAPSNTNNRDFGIKQTKYETSRSSATLNQCPTANNNLLTTLPRSISPFATFNPTQNTTNEANNALKNYMNRIGINQQQYDVITDANGRKVYKLKQSYYCTRNAEILDKYKTVQRKSIHTVTSNESSSKEKGVFNCEDYDEHIDEKGKKYYTLKKNQITTSSNYQRDSMPSPTSPRSQQLLLQSNSPSKVQITKDNYQSKQSISNCQYAHQTINNLPLKSRTASEATPKITTQVKQRHYNTFTSPANVIYGPYNTYSTNNNIVSEQRTTIERRCSNLDRYYNTLTTNQRNSNYDNNLKNDNICNRASINPSYGKNYHEVTRQYEQIKRPNVEATTIQQYERRVDKCGKTYQVNKRQSIRQSSMTKQFKQIQKQPNYVKQVYQIRTQSKTGPEPKINLRGERIEESSKYQYKQLKSNNMKSPKIDSYSGIKNSQAYNIETSSKGSLLTDSRVPSASKIINAHLYGDTKSYLASLNPDLRIQSMDQLVKLTHQLRDLEMRGNTAHFIVDTSHPLRYVIEKKADAGDNIAEIDIPDKVYECMAKKSLPTELFDIGFIFLHSKNQKLINPSSIVHGYYLVDIDSENPEIQIKRERKTIYLSNPQNIDLIRKLLLAPLLHHFIFYPRGTQNELSRILNLFPMNKFQKLSYTNRNDLQSMLTMHSKNKGRFIRALIFVNLSNIDEIASIMNNHFNRKNFSMICNTKEPVNQNMKYQYNKVAFTNNYQFNSYGSLINLANVSNNNYNNNIQNSNTNFNTINYVDNYTINTDNNQRQPLTKTSQKLIPNPSDPRQKIYIQRPHSGVGQSIQQNFPGVYDIRMFDNAAEITQKSRDNFILLHRDADNVGTQFDRNLGTLILLGGKKGDRIPSGTVSIGNVGELIQNIL